MNTLALVTALAAQATAPSGSTTSNVDTATGNAGSQSGTINYVDLEAAAGYSTNPVQQVVGSTGSAYGRFSVTGVHSRVSALSATTITAFGQESIYSHRSGSQLSADIRANHSARVNSRLSIWGSIEGSIDKGGQLDTRIIGNPFVPVVPGLQQPPVVLLPGQQSLFVRGRQQRLSADAGGALSLSSRDSVSFRSGFEYLDSKSGSFSTRYITIPVSVGYSRTLSARTSLGGEVQYEHTDFKGPGSFWDISPRLTLNQLLSPHLNLSVSIGPSFSSTNNGVTTTHSTGVAGSANLCSQTGLRTQFCGTLSISQQTATAIGASKSISAGFNYSRRLDANQTLRLSIDGSRYSTPSLLVTGTSFSHATYARAAADYSYRIHGGRWFVGTNVGARKLTQPGPDPKMDFSGSVFIRYRLGDIR